jgi:hypothetical protein
LPECRDARLSFGLVFFGAHQHANPPHALGLLRTNGERNTRRRPAKPRDELPPPHSITSSVGRHSLIPNPAPIIQTQA